MDGKKLGVVFNDDGERFIFSHFGKPDPEIVVQQYRTLLGNFLAAKPGIFAQRVGSPDPVLYRSEVATIYGKNIVEATRKTWENIYSKLENQPHCFDVIAGKKATERADAIDNLFRVLETGTDPLAITVEECHKHGVPIVPSYRMNSEDCYYDSTYLMSDLGRRHPEWRIPMAEEELKFHREAGLRVSPDLVLYPEGLTGALDPAVPEVYNHRMKIFREVAEKYDIDGIEFDFRRWGHQISDPLKNHPILTRMVRETREMLNEVARKKGRNHLLLGVRVGPMLEGAFRPEDFPGVAASPYSNLSCRDYGLDVPTWISEGIVDYVCPTLFWPNWPGLPRIREFAELAKGTKVGIYPTLFSMPDWPGLKKTSGKPNPEVDHISGPLLERYKKGIGELAKRIYDEGADGISTFNWIHHYPHGGNAIQSEIASVMGDKQALDEWCK